MKQYEESTGGEIVVSHTNDPEAVSATEFAINFLTKQQVSFARTFFFGRFIH